VPVDPVSGLNLEDVIATLAEPAEPPHVASDGAAEPALLAKKLSAEAETLEKPSLPPRPPLNW
jgi:hypothetical protein